MEIQAPPTHPASRPLAAPCGRCRALSSLARFALPGARPSLAHSPGLCQGLAWPLLALLASPGLALPRLAYFLPGLAGLRCPLCLYGPFRPGPSPEARRYLPAEAGHPGPHRPHIPTAVAIIQRHQAVACSVLMIHHTTTREQSCRRGVHTEVHIVFIHV